MSILITGACGTIGSQLVEQLQDQYITCLDNDENGLFELREKYGDNEMNYRLADITHPEEYGFRGIDTVYHCAALKHVDICETNTMMAIRTNVDGTKNVIRKAIEADVKTVVLISTDKAVNPIGVMGATKLLAEKLMHGRVEDYTKLITVRFGNIWQSRGSLYTRIKMQIEQGKPITMTDPKMKRYYFSIQEAAEFIIRAGEEGKSGEVWIPKMDLKPLEEIIAKITSEFIPNVVPNKKIIGIRPGEKMVEELFTEQEKSRIIEHDSFYVIPPLEY